MERWDRIGSMKVPGAEADRLEFGNDGEEKGQRIGGCRALRVIIWLDVVVFVKDRGCAGER